MLAHTTLSALQRFIHVTFFLAACVVAEAADQPTNIGPDTPEPLTKSEAESLVRPGGAWFTEGDHCNFEGFGVAITKLERTKISLAMKAGPKTNLGRMSGNMAGYHGGSLKIGIEAVLDENGNDIFDRSRLTEHSDNINPGKFENGCYPWGRTITIVPKRNPLVIKSIRFKARLSVPVDWVDFTFEAGSSKSGVHPLLSKVDTTKEGLRLEHPQPWDGGTFFVYGMHDNGDRLGISSQGYGGKTQDNHWFYPSGSGPKPAKFRLMMATGRVEKTVEFAISPKHVEMKPVYPQMTIAVRADSSVAEPKYILVLDGIAYTTVEELKQGIEKLPKGSRIGWLLSEFAFENAPLSTKAEIAALADYCKERGIKLNAQEP